MIGVNPGEDLHLLRFAAQLPVIARDLEGGFVRFGARRGEIDRRAIGVGELDQLFRQADRGNVGGPGIGRGEGELCHLRGGRLGQFLAAVPGIDVPQARETVDVLLALGIDQHLAASLDKHDRLFVILGMMQGVDQMALIQFDECACCFHGTISCLAAPFSGYHSRMRRRWGAMKIPHRWIACMLPKRPAPGGTPHFPGGTPYFQRQ